MSEPESFQVVPPNSELPRWIQVPVGVFLGFFTLLCLAGSVTLILAPPEKSPILAMLFGSIMAIACFWILVVCLRLITGRKTRGGLMGPSALRVVAWLFLLLPIGGLFTGYFLTHTLIALIQTAADISIFIGLRRLAVTRDQQTMLSQPHPPKESSSTNPG